MNKTVERIVELLFQDLVETDEVRAMREELMNNCQERCEDLMRRGMTEDEAIGAVVESLKGMDELLSQYPHKDGAAGRTNSQGAQQKVRHIHSQLKGWDLEILPSNEQRVDVKCDGERADLIDIRFEGEKLIIREKLFGDGNEPEKQDAPEWNSTDRDMNWSSFSELFRDFGNMFRKAMNNAGMLSHGQVTVRVPQGDLRITHSSASGNLLVGEISVTDLEASTASGDVTVRTPVRVARAQVNTTSGDIRLSDALVSSLTVNATSGDVTLTLSADHAHVSTTSGDIRFNGCFKDLRVTTISGDVNAEGTPCQLDQVHVNTVSGDIELDLSEGGCLRSLRVKTTSGDAEITLPAGEHSVHTQLRSISGDVENRVGDAGPNASVQISMETVSGDLSVK